MGGIMRITPIKTNYISQVSFGIKINGKEGSFEDLYGMLGFNETKEGENASKISEAPVEAYIDRGFYDVNLLTGKKIPARVIQKSIPNGVMLYSLKQGKSNPFCGFEEITSNGKLVKKTLYWMGFPSYVKEYKDEKLAKEVGYNNETHRKENVYVYGNPSYKIIRRSDKDSTTLDFHQSNKNGEIISILLVAPKEEGKGTLDCLVSKDGIDDKIKTRTRKISWAYLEMSIKLHKTEDNEEIIKALKHFQNIIYSPEYKNDFGKTGYLNVQLRDVIKYLEENNQ